jgi:hypothetical protein
MFYLVNGKEFSAALLTEDGVVVQASGRLLWMCGQRIEPVVAWATDRGMTWSVSAQPPPGLVLYSGAPMQGAERRLRRIQNQAAASTPVAITEDR